MTPAIKDRMKRGIDLFNQLTDESQLLNGLEAKLDETALRGFYLGWYSAMGGTEDLTQLSLAETDVLKRLALEKTRQAAESMAKNVEPPESAVDVISTAEELYFDYAEYRAYPELIGICAAAWKRADEKIETGQDPFVATRDVMLTALCVMAILAATTSTIGVAVGLSMGMSAVTVLVAGLFAAVMLSENLRESHEESNRRYLYD